MIARTRNMMSLLRCFAEDTSGATAVEYGLLVGGISVAIIVALTSIGQKIFGFYSQLSSGVGAAN